MSPLVSAEKQVRVDAIPYPASPDPSTAEASLVPRWGILGANARAYIRGLIEFRNGRVAAWCGTFCAAVRTAAKEAKRLGTGVDNLQDRWRIAAGNPRPDSAARRIIDTLPGHPILDVGAAEELADVSNQAARLALLDLEDAGVIRRVNTGRRNRAWEAVGLFELVDAFERRLRGRSGTPL